MSLDIKDSVVSTETENYDRAVRESCELLELKNYQHKGKKNRTRDSQMSKKKLPVVLPKLPSCKHADKGFHCIKLSTEDVADFQVKFYDRGSKIKQDIFILRHCAVSIPKRCRSKEGIPRKSHIMHFYIPTLSGSLVSVCRKTFTEILGIRSGRVKGVIVRYIESKKIPTENRGGNRQSKKFQRKFQSVHDFLSSKCLRGAFISCTNCGAERTALSPDQDVRKLWLFYNSNSCHDLRVVESYFRNVFIKHFNICFGDPSDREKDYCNKCTNKGKKVKDIKKDGTTISENEFLELKMLEMSYPPGEHYLFAPLPNNRDPIPTTIWRDGDYLNEPVYSCKIDSCIGQCSCISSYKQSIQSSREGLIVPGIELPSNNAEQYLKENERNQNGYMSHAEQTSQCSTFTTNQMIVTNPCHTYDIGFHHSTQPFPYGNIFVSGIVPNHGIQITQERNIIINPEKNLHTPGQIVNNSSSPCYRNSHTNIHSGQSNGHAANNCDSGSASNRHQLTSLQPTVKRKPLYKCVPCKLTFNSDITYNQHKSNHLNKKVLKCDRCNRFFIRRDSFDRHVKSHTVKIHKCSTCSVTFNHLINLQIHSKREHQSNNHSTNVQQFNKRNN